jgi:hypothetical protein
VGKLRAQRPPCIVQRMPNCERCGCPFTGRKRPNHTPRFCSRKCLYARRPLAERFWQYLKPGAPDACWEWSGSRDPHGYGRIQRGGRHGGHVKAHRASYEMHHGPIPDGLVVRHKCDNPPCCNPAHLEVGTMRDNSRDMAARGRSAAQRGHDNGRTKVPDVAIVAMRERCARGEIPREVAAAYGVTEKWLSAVLRGERRARAGGPIRPPRR